MEYKITKLVTDSAYHRTKYGQVYLADSLDLMSSRLKPGSVDLIMTSPPFGLVRKKDYGNADAHEYLRWFRPFAEGFRTVLKDTRKLGNRHRRRVETRRAGSQSVPL